jgi:bifunctional N-acetylglucosamine-1-phosphate-uridyltransferase/glucosamine-1-phosphate-acetyltransferase GlmU-like protein
MKTHKFEVITGGKNYAAKPQVLMTGVDVADNCYVPAGSIITTQAAADRLPFTSTRIYSQASP